MIRNVFYLFQINIYKVDTIPKNEKHPKNCLNTLQITLFFFSYAKIVNPTPNGIRNENSDRKYKFKLHFPLIIELRHQMAIGPSQHFSQLEKI